MAQDGTNGFLDVCAQDMWGAGYLAVRIFCESRVWKIGALRSAAGSWARLCGHHEIWVCLFLVFSLIFSLISFTAFQLLRLGIGTRHQQRIRGLKTSTNQGFGDMVHAAVEVYAVACICT